jgi:uncharacterized SAM-binding protein YcdF (DUF218 family)
MTTGSTSRRRRVALVLGSLSLLAGMAFAFNAGHLLVVQRTLSQPDAILSLASHESERLPAAVRLARANVSSRLLLTEPVEPSFYNCSACSVRVAWIASLGLSGDRVHLLERRVTNTYDEAVVARDYCLAAGLSRLVVVTSPYHTRRTLATFIDVFQGTDIQIGVEPALHDSPARPARWWTQEYDRDYVAYEWAALAWYALKYGVNPLRASGVSTVALTTHTSFLDEGA